MVLPVSDRITRVPPYSGASAIIIIVFAYRAFTFCGRLFQNRSTNHDKLTAGISSSRMLVLQPPVSNACRLALTKFGLFPFRSPLLRESLTCFLFLGVLRCFTSPGSLYPAYCIQREVIRHYPDGVPPFGNLRIKGCLRLPGAYRRLPRPSSPPSAKISNPLSTYLGTLAGDLGCFPLDHGT